MSSKLTETFAIDAILQAVCDGIHTSLGFENVCIDLPDPETGAYRTRAAHGWNVDDAAVNLPMQPAELRPLMAARFEVEGCHLIDHVDRRGADRRPPRHLSLASCAATAPTPGTITGCSWRCGRAAAR